MSKTALLIIDLQNDYFPGGKMELVGAAEAGENARRLLERFRSEGMPVIHIQHESVHEGASFFLPGSEGMEIHDCVRPVEGEKVILKHFANSFLQTGLESFLREQGVWALVVAGMMVQNCVDSTVRAAKELGFAVTLVHDACACPDLEFEGEMIPAGMVRKSFMASLGYAFARVVDVRTYLAG
ncbi:cysteine hydrolase family protein [Salidesulfovibrio onnuriiensis]|uniref:cysteine hydrolase family protein n=1 Tax=Salidesulfovibrio onnuriiensis TaxID=2583823 RepID=UPI0011C9D028|nr:cysteine hydrolase family protein [Salidesulfovibrio onnuriiensis]